MTIAKTAVHSDLPSTGGMSATFPVSPRYAGDTITVNLVAHTAGYALSTFNVKVGYDTTVLQYVKFNSDTKYNAPTLGLNTEGKINVIITGIFPGTDRALVTGDDISVGSVSFKVETGVLAGVKTGVLTLAVVSLVNIGVNTFANNVEGQILDARDGFQTEGTLELADSTNIKGAYVYASRGELMNMAALGPGNDVTADVYLYQVFELHTKADEAGGLSRTSARPTLCSDASILLVVCKYEHSP